MIKPPRNIQFIGNEVAILWPNGREDFFKMEELRACSPSAENIGEVEDFTGILGEIETSLAAFEQRCKKTKESFDEWNCVLIMYCYLRKYCDETKTNYAELMNDVLKLD